MTKAKPFDITRKEVLQAYKLVRANKGAGGVDDVDWEEFDKDLKNNLYKIWNRLSSGTYFPPPVKAVSIPKKSGGTRTLGIPTIADRIAQMVVKTRIEPTFEAIFIEDSYGYRPRKSALDAIEVTRTRCWKYDWVLEFDIVGLFDNISHSLLMKAVRKHVKERWQILYIERWLKAPVSIDGKPTGQNDRGTPQGGVISPLLANIFMHYAFDSWMMRELRNNPWCRYADDAVIHCKTQKQANYVKYKLQNRLAECELQLHPTKTKIVYCKDTNRTKDYQNCKFTFLGYEFRQRKAKGKNGKEFSSFRPAISRDAAKEIRQTIREWHLLWMTNKELKDIATKYNPIIRGWLNYYGKYGKRELTTVLIHINKHLCQWYKRKYRKYRHKKLTPINAMESIAMRERNMFAHWKVGITDMVG